MSIYIEKEVSREAEVKERTSWVKIFKLQDDLEIVNEGRKAPNQEVEQMRDEIALLNCRVVEQQRIIAALTKLGATEYAWTGQSTSLKLCR
ncbi:hypothetical protein PMIT1313_00396 [Prochlorococcus marinus str. MIT 1313]|nr:hypothetical protein PMIT1313_00396 [Prochlorococcus marinus str. MIT 1313]